MANFAIEIVRMSEIALDPHLKMKMGIYDVQVNGARLKQLDKYNYSYLDRASELNSDS